MLTVENLGELRQRLQAVLRAGLLDVLLRRRRQFPTALLDVGGRLGHDLLRIESRVPHVEISHVGELGHRGSICGDCGSCGIRGT
jgi:hypothetical protein